MYTINNYVSRDFLKLSNPFKYEIYRNNKTILLLCLISYLSSIAIILQYNITVSSIFLILLLGGTFYSLPVMKDFIDRIKIKWLRQLYYMKSVYASFGWFIVCAVLPCISKNVMTLNPPLMLSVFTVIFFRNLLLDIIAYQGDLIFGRETLPTKLGAGPTKIFAIMLSVITILIITIFALYLHNYKSLLLIINILYYLYLSFAAIKLTHFILLKYESLVDINLLLLSLILYIISI